MRRDKNTCDDPGDDHDPLSPQPRGIFDDPSPDGPYPCCCCFFADAVAFPCCCSSGVVASPCCCFSGASAAAVPSEGSDGTVVEVDGGCEDAAAGEQEEVVDVEHGGPAAGGRVVAAASAAGASAEAAVGCEDA